MVYRTRVPLPLDAGQVLGLHVELVLLAANQRAESPGRPGGGYGGEPLATSVAPASTVATAAVAASAEDRPP
jgi:hypothetical protein